MSGSWSDGSSSTPPATYSATGGTITAGGLYTAGVTPGAFRVIATHQGGTKADTSTVTITVPPPTLSQLVLSPATSTLLPGESQQFTVSGSWSDGSNAAPAVTYSATGGTITAGGLYTVGATPGIFRVIATHQGGTRADTSAVTVLVPPPTLTQLVLNPASLTLEPGATQQLTVTGYWSDGSTSAPAVTYSATGGTVTANGLFSAGHSPGTFAVIAMHVGGTKADTSAVTIVSAGSCLRTVNVETTGTLTAALSAALAGDCIVMAPGTYLLPSPAITTITRGGSSAAPVVLSGAGSSTIIDVNQQQFYLDASYFQIRSLRITNLGSVGFWLRGVTGVVFDRLEIDHSQQEAMAFKNGSHHNIIQNSLFHDTGIRVAQYGEGVYIGSSGDPGRPLDFAVTDNQVLNNHFGPNVRAEAIDVKEGADRTIIRGNFFDGTGSVYGPGTGSLVAIIANAVIVDSNFFQFGDIHAVSFIRPVTRAMSGNIMTRNRIDLRDNWRAQRGTSIPYGFQFQLGTDFPVRGALIACSNVMITGLLSNVPCMVYP